MSMWPTVASSDVVALWRPLTPDEVTVATARIALVEAELRRELRLNGVTGTPAAGSLGYDTQAVVDEWVTLYKGIVVEAVKDRLVNPDGWSSESEQIDDWAATRRRDSAPAVISEADVSKLLPPIRAPRAAFSIRAS